MEQDKKEEGERIFWGVFGLPKSIFQALSGSKRPGVFVLFGRGNVFFRSIQGRVSVFEQTNERTTHQQEETRDDFFSIGRDGWSVKEPDADWVPSQINVILSRVVEFGKER